MASHTASNGGAILSPTATDSVSTTASIQPALRDEVGVATSTDGTHVRGGAG